jgi:hypothetical protein
VAQSDGGEVPVAAAATFDPAFGWASSTRLWDARSFHADVVIDAAGRAIAAFETLSPESGRYTFARRHSPATGWDVPYRLIDESAREADIAMNDDGLAVITWHAWDGSAGSLSACAYR